MVQRTVVSGEVSSPQCSASGADSNPRVAVDPHHPQRLVVTYHEGNGAAAIAAFSRNGGRTFERAPLPGLTPCGGGQAGALNDPDLRFGERGLVVASESWVSDAQVAAENDALKQYVSVSRDGGRTFAEPVENDPGNPAQRGFIAIDQDGVAQVQVLSERLHFLAPVPGYLPAVENVLRLGISTDGARSFEATTIAVPPLGAGYLATGLQQSDGVLVAVGGLFDLADFPGFVGLGAGAIELSAFRSTDDGRTFGEPIQIGTEPLGTGLPDPCCLPEVASAPGGALDVAWAEEGAITIARSTDHGASWQRNTLDAAGQPEEPVVVERADGMIAVAYYDLGVNPERPNDVRPMLARTSDAGRHWRRTPLSRAFDISKMPVVNDTSPLGAVQGMVALPHGFGVAMTVGPPIARGPGGADVLYVRVSG